MIYTNLSHSDIKVSKICLGTMTFGEQNTEAEAHNQISYAIDQGINFIDTAEMYAVPGTKESQGSTERFIGSWLRRNHQIRKDLILATKVTGPSPLFSYISPNLGFGRSRILEAIDKSLERLQTDYIDLYQLHWPERRTNFFGVLGYVQPDDQWKDNFEEAIDTLNELIQLGKIRHWGLSNESPWGVMRSFECSQKLLAPLPISIQNPYNLLNRTFEIGLSEIAYRENLSMLAYSPLAFGLLSGKYHKGLDSPNDRINKFKRLSRYNGQKSFTATEKYLELADAHGLSFSQMALAFVNSRFFVTSTIIGATTMDQLKENIQSIELQLSDEILKAIEEIHIDIPNPAP